MKLDVPDEVVAITRRLEEAGHSTWAVGGAVRDAVLDLPSGDWDLATAARPKTVRRLFRRTVPIGIEHGTVGVLGRDGVLYEVTTFRRDVETFGRHAVVEFADRVEEDLGRRDFTCNAIAWHPLSAELRDPYGGVEDLHAGRLRTVGAPAARFAEDYLRVLRALRFAGHFALEIEAETWNALVAALPFLDELSAERVREELWKVLAKTERASTTLSLYAAAGVTERLYPELVPLLHIDAPAGHAFDAWAESLLAVDAIPTSRPLLRLAALLHAVGMPGARTRDLRGGWRYTGHPLTGATIAEKILRRLRFANAEIERVGRLVRLQEDLFPPDAPPPLVRRWLRHVGPDLAFDLVRLRIALQRANPARPRGGADVIERWRAMHAERLRHPPLRLADLALRGDDLIRLGLRPGPRFGEILEALLSRVVDDPSLNTRERLIAFVREELAT